MNTLNLFVGKGYLQKIFVGIILIIVLATGAILGSVHAGNQELVHACVNESSGTIKIVSPGTQCSNNQYPLEWSSSGSGESSAGGVFAFIGYVHANNESNCSSLPGNSGACSDPVFESPIPADGYLAALAIYPFINTASSNVTVTIIVNGMPTVMSVEIPVGSTTVQIINTPVAVEAGDLVMVKASTFDGIVGENVGYNGTILYQVP